LMLGTAPPQAHECHALVVDFQSQFVRCRSLLMAHNGHVGTFLECLLLREQPTYCCTYSNFVI
jgi:hypothetical protein